VQSTRLPSGIRQSRVGVDPSAGRSLAGSAAPFVADFTGFDAPWRLLAEFVPDLHVNEHAFGAGYLACGHYAPATP
jgi:hypothetical protein